MYIHCVYPLRCTPAMGSMGAMNIKMKSIALSAVIAASLAGCTTTHHVPATTATTTVYVGVELPRSVSHDIDAAGVLMPCPTEDSDDCYWASTRGNGNGHAFVAWKGHYYYAK